MAETIKEKSELLFLYETSYNIPNGDPFTGEQRYDEETKKILVSDVRIKRFVRSYLEDNKGMTIYVSNKEGSTDAKERIKALATKQEGESALTDIGNILKTCRELPALVLSGILADPVVLVIINGIKDLLLEFLDR